MMMSKWILITCEYTVYMHSTHINTHEWLMINNYRMTHVREWYLIPHEMEQMQIANSNDKR